MLQRARESVSYIHIPIILREAILVRKYFWPCVVAVWTGQECVSRGLLAVAGALRNFPDDRHSCTIAAHVSCN